MEHSYLENEKNHRQFASARVISAGITKHGYYRHASYVWADTHVYNYRKMYPIRTPLLIQFKPFIPIFQEFSAQLPAVLEVPTLYHTALNPTLPK